MCMCVYRFGWVWGVLSITEAEMLQTSGLDAVVHVRSYLLALRIFGAFTVYGTTTH